MRIFKIILVSCLFFILIPTTNASVSTGAVVINEFMPNPEVVSDSKGEWLELYNTTQNAINLNGWNISDLGTNSHTISTDLILSPQDFLVLARNGSGATNGGLEADYVYSSFTLGNSDDEIILTQSGGEIVDFVEYKSDWGIEAGRSLVLINQEIERNNKTNWTGSLVSYGDGDFGSPGEKNPQSIVKDLVLPISSSSLESGEFVSSQVISLSAQDQNSSGNLVECDNCQIFYTVDGTSPTINSTLFTEPFNINTTTILQFFAVDSFGNVESSVNLKTYTFVTEPNVPTNFQASVESGSVALSWDEVENVTEYEIYRSTNGGQFYDFLISQTETNYVDSQLDENVDTHIYKLMAKNLAGYSQLPAVVFVVISNQAILSSPVLGQAEFPKSVTSAILQEEAVLDFSVNVSSVESGSLVVGGEAKTLDNFTSGNLINVDLSQPQVIANQSISIEKMIKLQSGKSGSGVSILNSNFGSGELIIADGTVVMGDMNWRGEIIPPQSQSVLAHETPRGFSVGNTIVEIGSVGSTLLFDQPVEIIIEGVHSDVAYKLSGSNVWEKIEEICTGTYENPAAPTFPKECFISNLQMNKTKIYSYHLTTYANLIPNIPAVKIAPVVIENVGSGGGNYKVELPKQDKIVAEAEDVVVFEKEKKIPEKVKTKTSIGEIINLELSKVNANVKENNLHPAAAKNQTAFQDIQNHRAEKSILRLHELGIISGKKSGFFEPDSELTRAELVKIALLAFDYEINISERISDFTDVEIDDWYAPYLARAKKLKLIQGYADGTFRPNQTVNNAEALKVLLEAGNLEIAHNLQQAWYLEYLDFVEKNKIVDNSLNKKFVPYEKMLRAGATEIIVKIMQFSNQKRD